MRNATEIRQAVGAVFPERLKKLRQEIGISQGGLAEALGVSRASIGYYESGERLPDIAFLSILTERTGCDADFLLGRSENMMPDTPDFAVGFGMTDKECIEFLFLMACEPFRAFIGSYDTRMLFFFLRALFDYDFSKDADDFLLPMVTYTAGTKFTAIIEDIFRNHRWRKKFGNKTPADVSKELEEAYEMAEKARFETVDRITPWAKKPIPEQVEKPNGTIETDKVELFRRRLCRLDD